MGTSHYSTLVKISQKLLSMEMFQVHPAGRRPRADPDLGGEIISLHWPGNASGFTSQSWSMWPGKGKSEAPCWNYCLRDPTSYEWLTMDGWKEGRKEGRKKLKAKFTSTENKWLTRLCQNILKDITHTSQTLFTVLLCRLRNTWSASLPPHRGTVVLLRLWNSSYKQILLVLHKVATPIFCFATWVAE